MKSLESFVRDRVRTFFVEGDDNCAMSSLKILGEYFGVPLDDQVLEAAQCVPGAGGTGEVCGLLMGTLMFVGVWGARRQHDRPTLNLLAQRVTTHVQRRFGSVCCRDLQREDGCGPLAVEVLTALIPVLAEGMATL